MLLRSLNLKGFRLRIFFIFFEKRDPSVYFGFGIVLFIYFTVRPFHWYVFLKFAREPTTIMYKKDCSKSLYLSHSLTYPGKSANTVFTFWMTDIFPKKWPRMVFSFFRPKKMFLTVHSKWRKLFFVISIMFSWYFRKNFFGWTVLDTFRNGPYQFCPYPSYQPAFS